MRVTFPLKFAVTLAATLFAAAPSLAQRASPAADKPARPELALTYTFLRSNAPPGNCTCFNLNGGSATFAWPLKYPHFALVGDITAAHADGVSTNAFDLTLTSYTGGARFTPALNHTRLQPFAQALIGVAHASGSLVQASTVSVPNASASFAANLGGGLDIPLSHRFSLRAAEVDYLVTTFDNGSNNHQNILRISSGLVLHF